MFIPQRYQVLLLMGGVLLMGAVLLLAAAPRHHFTRPTTRGSLPWRDYQSAHFSQPVRALSSDAVPLRGEVSPDGAPAVPIKLYQFQQASLRIDHCSISQMAVQLHGNGHWVISLRADQNPHFVPAVEVVPNLTTQEEMKKFTEHLQRNQFFVRVRCYGQHGPGGAEQLLGRPVLAFLYADPFWVQRAAPHDFIATGYDPAVKEFFELIDRVEIEFFYRHSQNVQGLHP